MGSALPNRFERLDLEPRAQRGFDLGIVQRPLLPKRRISVREENHRGIGSRPVAEEIERLGDRALEGARLEDARDCLEELIQIAPLERIAGHEGSGLGCPPNALARIVE